jgi:hypothetical protein
MSKEKAKRKKKNEKKNTGRGSRGALEESCMISGTMGVRDVSHCINLHATASAAGHMSRARSALHRRGHTVMDGWCTLMVLVKRDQQIPAARGG